mmetsp:Transcript_4600/g.17360  ORF Transcript_4600/g.17360 Transcript_4600/m.17360 type:complete len:298 (+) Transcript_4600:2277-3170(+)
MMYCTLKQHSSLEDFHVSLSFSATAVNNDGHNIVRILARRSVSAEEGNCMKEVELPFDDAVWIHVTCKCLDDTYQKYHHSAVHVLVLGFCSVVSAAADERHKSLKVTWNDVDPLQWSLVCHSGIGYSAACVFVVEMSACRLAVVVVDDALERDCQLGESELSSEQPSAETPNASLCPKCQECNCHPRECVSFPWLRDDVELPPSIHSRHFSQLFCAEMTIAQLGVPSDVEDVSPVVPPLHNPLVARNALVSHRIPRHGIVVPDATDECFEVLSPTSAVPLVVAELMKNDSQHSLLFS